MIRAIGLLVALVCALAPGRADDLRDNAPHWKVRALHVSKPDDTEPPRLSTAATRVIVRLELPGRELVEFDEKKSKIDSFTDDKKTDLLAAPAGRLFRPIVFGGSGADRNKTNQLTFQAPGLPLPGATKLRVKGSIVAIVGKTEKQIELKEFDAVTGGDLGFGTLKGPAPRPKAKGGFNPPAGGFGETTNTTITYAADKPLKAIVVLDSEGKEITARIMPSTGFRAALANKTAYQTQISVNVKEMPRCTVRIKYFDTVEELTIPVNLDVGLGF